jgi:ATP-dependent RNA helicase MSS116
LYRYNEEIGDLPVESYKNAIDPAIADEVARSMAKVGDKTKAQTYQAWLGYYKPFMRKMRFTPEQLVAEANYFAVDVLGCPEVGLYKLNSVVTHGLKAPGFFNL